MIFGHVYPGMIVVEIFIDTLPKKISPKLVMKLMEALLWHQIYYIKWNFQRVRCNFPNDRLIMKTYELIMSVETH